MIFVTGGTGLIGGHIICNLIEAGYKVRALARHGSDMRWFEQQARLLLGVQAQTLLKNVEWVSGDLTDVVRLEEQLEGCKQVYHAAAMVSFAKKDKSKLFTTNVVGTQNLLNICLAMRERPDVCYVSSTATIGRGVSGVSTEANEFDKEKFTSYYGYTKYLAELEAYRARAEGLRVAIVNPCIVLGFGNWDRGSLGIVKKAATGFPFYTEGGNAFVDARDVAAVCIKLLENEIFDGRYLCIGENATFRAVFNQIADQFGVRRPYLKISSLTAEIAWRIAGVIGFITGTGLITRDSARSGQRVTQYDGGLLQTKISHEMYPLKETIRFAHLGFKEIR